MIKTKEIVITTIIILVTLIGCIFIFFDNKKIKLEYASNEANVDEYYIYGTHFNISGSLSVESAFNNIQIVLINKKNTYAVPVKWSLSHSNLKFYTNEYINSGLNLENIVPGKYEMLLKIEFDKEIIFYKLNNETTDENLEYYTLTKDQKNKKIEMNFESTLKFIVEKDLLPSNVYDIVIDPGHTGNDVGAVGKVNNIQYYERDLNLSVSNLLKKELENLGYKVVLTRNDNETTKRVYESGGSAVLANEVKAKYNFAIHHNSSQNENEYKGLEIYVLKNSNHQLSRLLVSNITRLANTSTSNMRHNYIENGLYVRNFNESQIADNIEYAKKIGYEPELITTNTPYYYNLREMGGRMTYALNDGRDPNVSPANPYYDSIHTCETYLIELGYMNTEADLENILKNMSGYAKGISVGLKEYLS